MVPLMAKCWVLNLTAPPPMNRKLRDRLSHFHTQFQQYIQSQNQ